MFHWLLLSDWIMDIWKETLSRIHNLPQQSVRFPRRTLNPLPYGAQWCSDGHSWRWLDKHRKRASRATIVMENSTTYLCCLANKKSTQYGPEGYRTACWVLACDLLITFASRMNLWHQFLCRFCYLKYILPLCEKNDHIVHSGIDGT